MSDVLRECQNEINVLSTFLRCQFRRDIRQYNPKVNAAIIKTKISRCDNPEKKDPFYIHYSGKRICGKMYTILTFPNIRLSVRSAQPNPRVCVPSESEQSERHTQERSKWHPPEPFFALAYKIAPSFLYALTKTRPMKANNRDF